MVLSVGAFYHPHLARETLELAGFIQHLAMADPPRADDPLFAKVRTRFTLLLHDFLGQLSEPVEASALERARRLVALYDPPWVAEHLQRVHTTAGDAFVDYVFPPPYTEDLLRDYARNARALQAALGRPLILEPIPTYLLGRHFYRERIVRLFAAGRRLSRDAGQDPLDVLATPAFEALLDGAELGSLVTADAVATLVEGVVAGRLAAHAWGPALVAYEGALFRAEAGPRQWAPATGAAAVRAATARVLTLGWDVTGLVAAVRRGDDVLPDPRSEPIRLLVTLAPDGRVTTVRASEALERVLTALEAPQTAAAALARALGTDEAACGRALQQLAAIGAVAWRDA